MDQHDRQQIAGLAALLAASCAEFCDRTITAEMADEMIRRLLARARIAGELLEHDPEPG